MMIQNQAGVPLPALLPLYPVEMPLRRLSQQSTQVQAGGCPPYLVDRNVSSSLGHILISPTLLGY
jgi:hypothetical protein